MVLIIDNQSIEKFKEVLSNSKMAINLVKDLQQNIIVVIE